MKELLNGAWDLHFHTAPDVVPRKYTDLELAEEWSGAGMKGGVSSAIMPIPQAGLQCFVRFSRDLRCTEGWC